MKTGVLTTEFWLVVVSNVLVQAGTIDVPERYRWLVPLATVTGYAISRGLAKLNAPLDLRPIALGDPSLDDPSLEDGDEPHEPAAVPPSSSSSSGWQDAARAAGWAPPAQPTTPGAA